MARLLAELAPPSHRGALFAHLQSRDLSAFYAGLRDPDAGLFRSYYLVAALQSSDPFVGDPAPVDDEQHIVEFQEKPDRPAPLPGRPGRALASMGVYVFTADFLAEQLARDAAEPASSHDFGNDLVPSLIGKARIFAHRFETSCVNMVGDRPYWRDVGTLDAYWEANIDLTRVVPELNLYDEDWPMPGREQHRPPAKFVFDEAGRRGIAIDSLVSSGCIVSGSTVRRSILFYGVRVAEGSVVEDSVVLPEVVIGRGVRLQRTIVDKGCVLPDGFQAGLDPLRDSERFEVTELGITLITPGMLGH
jgi:glucose-1-phosphate adenylyltransferase